MVELPPKSTFKAEVQPVNSLSNNKKRIFIIGGCVSRDIIELAEDRYEIVEHIGCTSLASAFLDKPFTYVDQNTIDEKIEKSFERKFVQCDHQKNLRNLLIDTEYDILIMDFLSERFNLIECGDEVATLSYAFERINFHKSEMNVIDSRNFHRKEQWKKSFKEILDIAHKKKARIFLNKIYPAKKENNGKKFPETWINEMKNRLEWFYNQVPDYIQCFSVSENILIADQNHKWGGECPYHYIPPVYENFLQQFDSALKGTNKKYFTKKSLHDEVIKKENIIPVVFCVDNKVSSYLSVTIQSIIENASNNNFYKLHVFCCNVDRHIILKLKEQINGYKNISIEFFKIQEKIIEYREIFSNSLKKVPHITESTYGRFFIPELLNNFEKVIYSDVDVIYEEDIAGLMSYDLGENYIGAVIDPVEEIKRKQRGKNERTLQFERLSVFDYHPHINAGIIIINVKQWIDDNVKDKLINILSKETFELGDQDAINVVCKDKITFLDEKWNIPVRFDWFFSNMNNLQYDLHSFLLMANWMKLYTSNKGATHFTGDKKPWDSKDIQKYDRWMTYAKNTPFHNDFKKNYKPQTIEHQEKIRNGYKKTFRFLFIPFLKIKKIPGKAKFYLFGINFFTIRKWAL